MSKLNDKFLDVADWVSEAMGKPGNIVGWGAAVTAWTLLFALDHKLAHASFLPSWFTSQAFNFPLNLITTVAELFIGFLVAAATNRAQRALTEILNYIKHSIDNDVRLEKRLISLSQQQESELVALRELILGSEQRLHQRMSHINRPRLEVKEDTNGSIPSRTN